MKKNLLSVMLGLIFMFVCFNAKSQDWQMLDGQKTSVETKINLLSSGENQIRLEFVFDAYAMEKVSTSKGEVNLINIPNCSRTKIKGTPDLPKISQALAIPNNAGMELKIIDSKFVEIDDVDLAPSKGVITRDKDPKTIPFVYGDVYSKDEFYPSNIAKTADPYIIRNVRGQNVTVYPVQYNPVTKKVRIYTHLTVELVEKGKGSKNTLNVNSKIENDVVFDKVLTNHFINYTKSSTKYTPVSESGKKMLIVCYSDFMDEMASFVAWKESIGYTVSLVNYSTIGSASALKTYVQNQYDQNGISYLLLVGDDAQVSSSSTSAGDSDNNYGYTAGSDHYLDIFVGRFSAENATQLQTQIDRTIYYERDLNSSDTWFKKGVGVASNEGGSGGDDGESDEVHMNNIENDLEGFGYTMDRVYQDGGSASQLSTALNSGRGIINYVGHGSNTTWASMVYTQTNVNSLTNENKLPFVISVACVVGNFTGITCFAETWLRATNNGNPTGAIVFCGSTINQSWASPMCAQDEMNDLLVANTYINYGGMFVNGMFQMIDEYGTDGVNMADTWTVFGDPSLQMRTPGQPDGPAGAVPTVPVANFSASSTTVSESGSVNFTSTSTGSPTSYSWTFEGGTPATSTAQNPTVTYSTIGTYNVSLTVTNSEGNDTETKTDYITVQDYVPTYCTSQGNDFSYEWIAGVTIGDFTNTSTGTAYSDFTSKTVNMTAGTDYAVSLTPGFKSSTYNEYWKIWVDLNADGDFDDTDELVFDAGALSKTAVTGTATIPAGTSSKSTRMRVSMKYNGAQTACESFSYGEVEDYTVVISQGVVDTEAPTVPSNLSTSSITSSSVSLSWNASTDNIGVTEYDVYKDGSFLASISSTSYGVSGLSANTTYTFYVKAKDAAGNVSLASNTLNVTTLENQVTYCASQGNNYSYEWIDYVALGEIANTSTGASYSDFTSMTANVALGSSQTIYFSCGFSSSTYTEYWHAWIDWDHSGTFDSDEEMATGSSSSSANLSGTFTVPSDAVLGTTRMRVTMKYNAAATSCETFSYGEVEDYTVNVTTARNDNRINLDGTEIGNEDPTSISIYPNPAEDHINVMVSNGNRIGTISIYSVTGNLIKVVDMNGQEQEIQISDIPVGVYFISVDDEKESLVTKFIKR
ncbi:MAG: T9SS type A sorting domain-containing protein [Bacteroidales bacterium]|nr:T9SS type A sorting domain-containing protein [Bacteroidales bacterium]